MKCALLLSILTRTDTITRNLKKNFPIGNLIQFGAALLEIGMLKDKHGKGNHRILKTVCCQGGKRLKGVGNVSCDQASRSYSHLQSHSTAVIRQTVLRSFTCEVWSSEARDIKFTPTISLGSRLWTRVALFPNPQQRHHYLYKTPVASRQSSKRMKTRIAKRYCQTQCIALHSDRFATLQHISVLILPSQLCLRVPSSSFLQNLQPMFFTCFLF